MEHQNPEISIIIVNWNGKKILPDCLKSIAENPPSVSYKVFVVDNLSSDNSPEWLKSNERKAILDDDKFSLVEPQANLGFARGNNLAINQTDSPYIFILNPDTIVKEGAIDKLLETLKSDKKIGAVAPKLLNGDGTLQKNVWGFPPTPLSIIIEYFYLYEILRFKFIQTWIYRGWTHNEKRAVPMFMGAAILAKKEMINEVGAFDEDFFMYAEDFEWCVRINNKGWKTFFEPEAEIIHLGGQSSAQCWTSKETLLKIEQALILFHQKWLSKPALFVNSLTRIFVYSIYLLRRIFLRKEFSLFTELIKLHFNLLKSLVKSRDLLTQPLD